MDTEDRARLSKHLEKLLAVLQAKRVLTNQEVRAVAGSRGMGRVNELQKLGHPITVRPYSQLRRVASSSGLEVLEIRPFTYTGGQHWDDPHDLRSYNEGGFTMRGCFNQTQAHVALVAA